MTESIKYNLKLQLQVLISPFFQDGLVVSRSDSQVKGTWFEPDNRRILF